MSHRFLSGGRQQWKDVPGQYVAEVEFVLPFLSTGYYDPGKTSGPPERCYPPEGDDERTYGNPAYLDFGEKFGKARRLYLTVEQTEELLEMLDEEIMDIELEPIE